MSEALGQRPWAELWTFAKEAWERFFKAPPVERLRSSMAIEEEKGTTPAWEGAAGSSTEFGALPTAAGRNICEPDALLDALEGELATDRARSGANARAGRFTHAERDPVAEEQ